MPRRLFFRVSGAGFISLALVLAACSSAEQASTELAQDAPIDVCIHDRLSEWECPDSLANMTLVGAVKSLTLSVEMADGKTFSYPLPRNTDGIFLTKPSTKDFLLRYYDATGQTEKAKKLREYLNKP